MNQISNKIFITTVAPLVLSLALSPTAVFAATIASGTSTYTWSITGIDIQNSRLPYSQAGQGYYYYPPNNTLRERYDFAPAVFDGTTGTTYTSNSLLSSATGSISAISPQGGSFLTSGSVTMQTSATSVKEFANTLDRNYSSVHLSGAAIRPTLDPESTDSQKWTISTTLTDTSPGWSSSSDPLVNSGYGYSDIYATFWMGTGWRDEKGVLWNAVGYTSSAEPVNWDWNINPYSEEFYFSNASTLSAYYQGSDFSWINVDEYTFDDFQNASRPDGFDPYFTYSTLSLSLTSYASESGTAGQTPPPNPVPEPATLALLCLGLAGLGFARGLKQ